jgi:Flp pilus assembly protein TadG
MTTSPRPRPRSIMGLRSDRRGAAAVEFVLVAPLMVTLFFGLFAMVQLVRVRMVMSSTASSMANMVAAQIAVTSINLNDYCDGAKRIMRPYAASGLSMAIITYTMQSDRTVTVSWEYDKACPTSSSSWAASGTTLATSLLVAPGDSIVVVQASYIYPVSYGYAILGLPNTDMTLTQTAYARSRSTPVKGPS